MSVVLFHVKMAQTYLVLGAEHKIAGLFLCSLKPEKTQESIKDCSGKPTFPVSLFVGTSIISIILS